MRTVRRGEEREEGIVKGEERSCRWRGGWSRWNRRSGEEGQEGGGGV
jgi:hypothetical protein